MGTGAGHNITIYMIIKLVNSSSSNHMQFFFIGATVGIHQTLDHSLVEGELDSLTTTSICVTVLEVTSGGLERDIIVNVSTLDMRATGSMI